MKYLKKDGIIQPRRAASECQRDWADPLRRSSTFRSNDVGLNYVKPDEKSSQFEENSFKSDISDSKKQKELLAPQIPEIGLEI